MFLYLSFAGLRARGRRRDVVAEAGGVGADPARRGMAEVDVDVEKEGGGFCVCFA